jgi:hypothetical protein
VASAIHCTQQSHACQSTMLHATGPRMNEIRPVVVLWAARRDSIRAPFRFRTCCEAQMICVGCVQLENFWERRLEHQVTFLTLASPLQACCSLSAPWPQECVKNVYKHVKPVWRRWRRKNRVSDLSHYLPMSFDLSVQSSSFLPSCNRWQRPIVGL